MIFRLLTSVEGVRGHESAGGAVVEEELIEAQRRALHKEHKEHEEHKEHKEHREHMEHKEHKEHKEHMEHMTMMLYFLR